MRKSYHSLRIMAFYIAVACTMATILSCSNKYFIAVIQPTKIKKITKDMVKVQIDVSSSSLIKNRIAIVNKSDEPISVYPIDIVLRIDRTGVILPAVTNYREYVRMRYEEAKKKCAGTEYPRSCSGAINKGFKKFLKVKPFKFGDIPPHTKRVGYFAFNLPDPFNTTEQSKRVANALRPKMNLLGGQIEISAAALSTQRELEFVFPVNVITSSDENSNLLGILRNY